MHTVMVVSGGLALMAVAAMVGKMTSLGIGKALLWFIPVWLVCASINMWIGVSQAGHSVAQEFPILILVFGVPAIIALLLYWRIAR